MTWVDSVWKYIPATLRKPENVTEDKKGGVTQATFDEFLALSTQRASDKLEAAGVPVPEWGEVEVGPEVSIVLRSAVSQIIAGYILRMFPAYEALFKDYFANGFASLDDAIADALSELGNSTVPEFVDEPEDDISGFAFPSNW